VDDSLLVNCWQGTSVATFLAESNCIDMAD